MQGSNPLFSPPAHFVVLLRCSDAAQTKQLCDVMGRTISHRWPSPQLQSTGPSQSRYSGSSSRARWKTLLNTSTSCAWTERLQKKPHRPSPHAEFTTWRWKNNGSGGKKTTRTSAAVLWNVRLRVSKKKKGPAAKVVLSQDNARARAVVWPFVMLSSPASWERSATRH